MEYNDMNDGQSFIYWATGTPPQEHLDDIKYTEQTSQEIYNKFIEKIKRNVGKTSTMPTNFDQWRNK